MKDNIYLISSSSFRLVDDEIKKIVGNNNYTSYDFNNIELDEILEEAAYISLFLEKKYMVVRNASIFGSSKSKDKESKKSSKDSEKLLNYLEEPNPNTIIIFIINGKVDSKKKIVKIIKDKYNLIEIGELKPKEIISLSDKTLKRDGYKSDYDTLAYIVNCCHNNYDLVYNELAKIKLYYGSGKVVKFDDVTNIVSRNILDNNFKFIDAIVGKNIKEAFKYYDDFMIQKVEPIMILSMLAKEYRNILLVKKMINRYSKRELMQQLGINYDFQMDKLFNNSYSYKEEKLEEILVYLCDLDYKIKSGKVSNKLGLQLFILKCCV